MVLLIDVDFLSQLFNDSSFASWFLSERTATDIRKEMADTIGYLNKLSEVVRVNRKKKKGPQSVKDALIAGDAKRNEGLGIKISVIEYKFGKQLITLLGANNFAFMADKVEVKHNLVDREKDMFQQEVALKHNQIMLDVDSLQHMWKDARKHIAFYIRDYVEKMGMSMELPQEKDALAKALRTLASEVIKLYEEADPHASDEISRQAQRKLLTYTSQKSDEAEKGLFQGEHVLHPEEVRAGRAYKVLYANWKEGKISTGEFNNAASRIITSIPKEHRKNWLTMFSSKASYHGGFAKFLSETIAPLVETLDRAFDPRAVIAAIGNRKGEINFEPDYLVKTMDGKTLWGEYLGMAAEDSSAGTHYNIRSLLKKMGYGDKGIFFLPHHAKNFPNKDLLALLHQHNVIGLDPTSHHYYTDRDGKKDYIILKTGNPPAPAPAIS